MSRVPGLLALLLACHHVLGGEEPAAKHYMRWIYGADNVDLAKVCQSHPDLWMLRGERNAGALAALDRSKIDFAKRDGIISGVLGTDIVFVEVRDGLVNPAFSLEGVHALHRQLVLMFLCHCLDGDTDVMKRLVTDPANVEIGGNKAAPGDMDQYAGILALVPVLRSSRPEEDARTKSVTYRVPLGEQGLALTLVKKGSTWRVDTSKKVVVPMEFFFRQ